MTKTDITLAATAATLAAVLLASGAHAQPFPHGRCVYNPNIDSYSVYCNVSAQAPALPVTTLPPSGPSDFQQGLADRTSWENWFANTTGEFHAGAYWWTGQRSLPFPGMCETLGGDATTGCLSAKARLDVTDYRRKIAPAYRMGWNSYTGTPVVAAAPAPVAPPAATPAPQVNVTVNNVVPQIAPSAPPAPVVVQAPAVVAQPADPYVNIKRDLDAMCKDMSVAEAQAQGMLNTCRENHTQLVEMGAAR